MNRLFAKGITILVGGGPSLNECPIRLGLSYPQVHYLAINDAYRLIPESKLFYACDYRWWEWNYEAMHSLPGIKLTIDPAAAQRWSDLYCYTGLDGVGLCKLPNTVHTGKNSGYQALNVAYHCGAKRIILLGYDLQKTNQQTHWFLNHQGTAKAQYSKWISLFEPLAKDLLEAGIEVVNCSPRTALTVFPCGDFTDTLKRWNSR